MKLILSFIRTVLLTICLCLVSVLGVELTFELPDNAKQCFHEDVRQGVKSTVEFQVSYDKCDTC